MTGVRVEVRRGGHVESVHEVDVAVAGGDGRLRARSGAIDRPVFTRSSIKPFQALPLVDDGVADRYELTEQELALCCASHNGEPEHVEVARSILRKIGLDEARLACGADAPYSRAAARTLAAEGVEPGRIHNNCSGKHAGMLALALAHGWPTEGYHARGHPVQERVGAELARWAAVEPGAMWTAVDGCGVVTFAVPLRDLAAAFARLGAASAESGSAAGRIVRAMVMHPAMVAGRDRLCTRLMEVTRGRVVAKIGAEGVYGAVAPGAAMGVALKVRDGARRGAEVALLHVLRSLDLLAEDEAVALAEWWEPPLLNTRGERVGELAAVVELEGVHG